MVWDEFDVFGVGAARPVPDPRPVREPIWKRSADSGVPITVTHADDPASALLLDGHTTTPTVYRRGCFICEDPEFAQMGLSLCRACPACVRERGRAGQRSHRGG